jgi:hypothetical protein
MIGRLHYASRGTALGRGNRDAAVMAVAGTQHHPVLAEGDRLPVLVGRDVLDGQRRHSNPWSDVEDCIELNIALNSMQFLRQ